MLELLARIKRLVLANRYRLTEKTTIQRESGGLSEEDVLESIMNAQRIYKTINSTGSQKKAKREKLYVIFSFTYDDILVYTKSRITNEPDGSMCWFHPNALSIIENIEHETNYFQMPNVRYLKVVWEIGEFVTLDDLRIPSIEYEHCKNSGEKFYDKEASLAIDNA